MRILIVVEGGVVQHILAAHQLVDGRGPGEPEKLQIFLKDYDESEYRSDCKPSELPVEFVQNFQFDDVIKEKF